MMLPVLVDHVPHWSADYKFHGVLLPFLLPDLHHCDRCNVGERIPPTQWQILKRASDKVGQSNKGTWQIEANRYSRSKTYIKNQCDEAQY
jgi:hypothetical protein